MIVLDQQIALNDSEQILARLLATLRNGINSVCKVRSQKVSDKGEFEINLHGMGGEIAYAKYMNLCPDFSVSPRKGGHDFLSQNGETVDVKTASKPYHNLVVSPHKAKDPCDFYALMTGEFPKYCYRGEISKEELFIDFNLSESCGNGWAYVVEQERLNR